MTTPDIQLDNITVRFGAVTALESVSLSLPPGARVAVVGENGAGKSTLMRVLFGLLPPDSGQLTLNGQPTRFTSPRNAIAAGIGMVQQHFDLIAPFTVAENIILGNEPRTGARLNLAEAYAQLTSLAEENGLAIDPRARVSELSVAAQQRVEILKALYRKARVLILDEPTATLAPPEARELWAATRRLSAQGVTVVFITHKLDEVVANADSVTVLRRGKHILTKEISHTNPAELAAAMVGSESLPPRCGHLPGSSLASPLPEFAPSSPEEGRELKQQTSASPSSRELANMGGRGDGARNEHPREMAATWGEMAAGLTLQSLTVGRLKDFSLTVAPGEIVGIAGVDGSGQTELIEAIVGLRKPESGTITSPETLGFIPEDRHRHAVAQSFSLAENAVLGRHREAVFMTAGGLIKKSAIREFLAERVAAFDVRGGEQPHTPMRSLSGGNQQKLVLARELSKNPSVIIASQPTRGLDFAATEFVHQRLREAADNGAAVLVQSLDLGEVLALADRVAVLLEGKLVGVVDRIDATEERIGALMTGASV
ncbi:ABC transporter ATP-binding protein [Armatimonas sp.]|uniref:ABC transporter ATP-binding protein n=1 Tax=Armatimonas sp. TaxID=1872638 RepID=UPI00286CD542|nr:ABC transporter ATP-binding protein [Armatimonas sp.]